MSLDISLKIVNENWDLWLERKEKSIKEADTMIGLIPIIEEYYEKREPSRYTYLFEANITHNLGKMADAAGIYEACWRPENINAEKAKDIVDILEKGLEDMKLRPEFYEQFNSSNGWGLYVHFLPWVEKYLNACKQYPEASIEISR